jgi:hypothetical protein
VNRFGSFYIIAKVHKVPWSSRPITSYPGSPLYNLGVWLDHELQKIVAALQYVATSSTIVADELKSKGALPPGARLFTMDAVSMYTNIHTPHAFRMIKEYFVTQEFLEMHAVDSPDAVLNAVNIIMTHSLFRFDGKIYLQKSGTAMGAPPAPMYATLYFYIHERLVIPQHHNLFYYKRYIDDCFGIWIPHPDPEEDMKLFDSFVFDMNAYGKLSWICSPRNSQVNFLD